MNKVLRRGKPPPEWFNILSQLKGEKPLTRAEVAEMCDISLNAVNQAYKRYRPEEVPGMLPSGRMIKLCSPKELKKMALTVLNTYSK